MATTLNNHNAVRLRPGNLRRQAEYREVTYVRRPALTCFTAFN